jgi:hypothetical protein
LIHVELGAERNALDNHRSRAGRRAQKVAATRGAARFFHPHKAPCTLTIPAQCALHAMRGVSRTSKRAFTAQLELPARGAMQLPGTTLIPVGVAPT